MKKYLLGITAVLLAVGFSSFTGQGKKVSDVTTYWFNVNLEDVETSSGEVNSSDATFIEMNNGD